MHIERRNAKWSGTCRGCGQPVAEGADILWTRKSEGRKGRGSTYHWACGPAEDVAQAIDRRGVAPTPADDADERDDAAPTPSPVAGPFQVVTDKGLVSIEAMRDAFGILPDAKREPEHRDVVIDVMIRREGRVVGVVENAHPLFDEFTLYATSGERCAYLFGAPGGGKSFAALALATALGIPFRSVSLSPAHMPSALLGYQDAHGRYVSTAFREVWEKGGVICIDEVDNAAAPLLTMLNTAIANGRCEFPDGMIERHADCVIVATGNTPGFGPTAAFPERRPLDRAFRDRFSFIEWTYDENHERAIARAKVDETHAAVADAWSAWVHKVRAYAATSYPALTASPRAIYNALDKLVAGSPVDRVAAACMFQGIDRGVVAKILAACPLPTIRVKAVQS